ncbi:MAG: hypothetical protein ACUVQP_11220 [Bacteroidales bacterium]
MKILKFRIVNVFFMCLSLFSYSQNKNIPKSAIKGDFNGDNIIEYAWIDSIYANPEGDNNFCYVKFSNPKIKSLKINASIGANITNEGDLNDDGNDEIGILPMWWTGTWRTYHVYTYKNNSWQELINFEVWLGNEDKNIDYISKDKSRPGFVKIHYYKWTEDMSTIVDTIESVPIKK